MEDQILDSFDEFDEQTRIVVIKHFYFESQARLYAARLKEAGIKCVVSNATLQTMLPVEQGGIKLLVRETDYEAAGQIVREMDQLNNENTMEGSFHEIDQQGIAYLKSLDKEKKGNVWLQWLVVLILLLLLIRAFLRAGGWVESGWDFF